MQKNSEQVLNENRENFRDKPESGVSRRNRINKITRNFFLHIHSARIHPHALKPTYTLGFGIMLGFLFVILLLTGVTLMFYYTPSVEGAYQSVKDIIFVVPGGRIIRNMHRWAAHGMVILVFLHMIRVFYTGSYSDGRSTNWVIGVAMLVVVLLMSFSGYLLPWDQLAFWAVTIGSNIAGSFHELTDLLGITSVIDIGGFFKKILIGDVSVGQPALTRFFALHVIFLPVTLLVLTGVHFWRIRKDGGLSRPISSEQSREKSDEKWLSWPVLMWLELAVLLSLLVVLIVMAIFVDAPLLEQANPSIPENPAKSPWYFLGIQEMVSYSAFTGGVLVPLLYLGFLISIPYLDREEKYTGIWFSSKQGLKITLLSIVFAIAVISLILWFYTDIGWLRDWIPGISQFWVMLLNPASLLATIFILYSIWIRKRTRSMRMSSIALFSLTLTAFIILTLIGIKFRGPDWEFYWSISQWPK
ncbi:MAG: cytochrome b N-terminal domain-containing protein [Bacteroidales bacterium]